MATKVTSRSRPPRHRLRNLLRTVGSHWLLVLVSHTVAVALLLLGHQLVHVSGCGGR